MDTAQAPTFASLLKQLRLAAGLTQEDLAERASMSARAISDLERGAKRMPYKTTIELLARALELSPQDRAALEAAVPTRRGPGARRGVSARPSSNLPHHLTPLLGREQQEAEVVRLIRQHDVRLLTLCGPGGVGKTRLGLRVAEDVSGDFPDGVVMVSLAPIDDADLVIQTIAEAIGIVEGGDHQLYESVASQLRDRRQLLVLDNFEQVQAAAPLIADILGDCPRVKAIVTSRAALRIRGEREFTVPPLALSRPDQPLLPDSLEQSPAVRLFVQRAQAVRPDFSLTPDNAAIVAAICARLDGLPLAIELAAARVKMLPLPALLARLEHRLQVLTGGPQDLPARQQTLRDTMAWSYHLLDAHEQRLFRGLAVFVNGFSLEAAEAVSLADANPPTSVLDTLSALVNDSLVLCQPEGDVPRFGMLETIREYGRDRLEASGEREEVERRHALFFLALSEEAEPELRGANQGEWLARLNREHDNLRAALSWSRDQGEVELCLRLAGALWRFWYGHRHLREGRRWLEAALQPSAGAAPALRARALTGLGHLAWQQGDHEQARQVLDEALELYRSVDNRDGTAITLNALGLVAWNQGDYTRAAELWREAQALSRELGDLAGLATSLNNLGILAMEQRQYDRATALYYESLALFRTLHNKRGIGLVLNNLGNIAIEQTDYPRARTLHEEALTLHRELGDAQGTAMSLDNLGALVLELGDHDGARSFHTEALKLYEELGNKQGAALVLNNLGALAISEGDHVRAAAFSREGLALYREAGNRLGIVESLEQFGGALALQGAGARAATLLGAAHAHRAALAVPLPARLAVRIDGYLQGSRALLSQEAWTAAWNEGGSMSLEQAAEYAFTDL